MNAIDHMLAERGKRYGDFMGHAHITQCIKREMQNTPRWADLKDDQKEALEMIAHKIGRILNGDPDYDDSWRDIAGYAQLVVDRLAMRLASLPASPASEPVAAIAAPPDALPPYVDRFLAEQERREEEKHARLKAQEARDWLETTLREKAPAPLVSADSSKAP